MAKGRKHSASGQGGSRSASAVSVASRKKKSDCPEPVKLELQQDASERQVDIEKLETESVAESDLGKIEDLADNAPVAADLDINQGDYQEPSLTEIIVSNYDGNRSPTGLYDGYGEATFVSGNTYKGNFEKGQMHGKGIYSWTDGMRYEGDFSNNHITGYGTYKWPDGSSYEGEVSNGLRHGVGAFSSPRQSVSFNGQWYLGKRHGRGMMNYGEQSWYEGDWVNNARHGFGIRRYKTGNVFEGHWTNDKRHGEGTMRWKATDETYRGMWENGVQHGYGTHTWYLQRVPGSQYPLRNEYVGEFVNGLRHGRGKFLYASGALYDGEWENSKKSGWGKFVFNNGRIFEGQFDNDHMVDYPTVNVSGGKTPDLLQFRPRTPADFEAQDLCSDSLEAGGSARAPGNTLKLEIETLLEEFPESQRSEEMKQVVHLALRNIAILRRAYTFYSALGHDQSLDNTFVMTRFQFWRFLKDCRIHHTQKSLFAMDRAIAHCHSAGDIHNPMEKMLLREFLSNVVILAHFIYKDDPDSKTKDRNFLAGCLQKLLDRHVSKYACDVKGYFLSEQRRAITALGYMDKCWQIYLAIGTPNREPPYDLVIKMRQLLLMLQDLKIVKFLPASKIVKVLCRDDPNVTADGICNLELDMTFLEFFEALIGCAMEIDIKPSHTEESQHESGRVTASGDGTSPTETTSQRQDDSASPTGSTSRATLDNQSAQHQISSTSQLKTSSTFESQPAQSSVSQVASKKDVGPASTGALLQTLSLMSKDREDTATNPDDSQSEVGGEAVPQIEADHEYSEWAGRLHYFFNVKLFPAWEYTVKLRREAAKFRKEETERLRLAAIEEEMERRRQSLREREKTPDQGEVEKVEEAVPEPEVVVPEPVSEPVQSASSTKAKSGRGRKK